MHQLQSDQLIIAAVNAHDKVQAGIALVHHLQQIEWLPIADMLNNRRYSMACANNYQNGTQRTSSCKAYGIGHIHSGRLYCELIIHDALTSEAQD